MIARSDSGSQKGAKGSQLGQQAQLASNECENEHA